MPASRIHLVSQELVHRTVAWLGMSRVLSEGECEVFERLATDGRRRDWLAGRVAAKRALRRAAREMGGCAPAYHAITVWNEGSGAPCFDVAGRPDLACRWNVSIAHTGGTAVAAVADTHRHGTVGADIEPTQPLSAALIRRVLTNDEARRLDTHHAGAPEPIAMWCIKEAVLKATRGRCSALRDIELMWDERGHITARIAALDGSQPVMTVTHGVLGAYTVARALWRTGSLVAEYSGSRFAETAEARTAERAGGLDRAPVTSAA